jgi:hypothetical protein
MLKKYQMLIALSLLLAFNTTLVQAQTGNSSLMDEIQALCQTMPSSSGAVNKFSDEELVDILKAEGYTGVKIMNPGKIMVKMEGSKVVLFNKQDGDLQFYYAASGGKWEYEDMNEWNRKKRLTRAYLDQDKDPTLESDLLSDGGLTKENVKAFINVFAISKVGFRFFLMETNRK